MKIFEVKKAVAEIAPWELAAGWDNSGFLIGDENADVKKIYVCLDVVHDTVDDSIKHGCNLIVAHHPVIFSGIKRITNADFTGSLVLKLIANGINVIAAHTNFDSSEMGVNYVLAKELGLINIEKMTDDPDNPCFIGNFVKAAGLDLQKKYQNIAVCGGAGTDLWPSALQCGAEVLISADGKHHVGLEAAYAGIAVFDGGHFHTENLSMKYLESYLKDKLPGLEIVLSDLDNCPWKIY